MNEQSLAVLVPVLKRPHRVRPLLESLFASTAAERSDGWQVRPVFVCSAGDSDEIAAIHEAGYDPLVLAAPGYGEYVRKINLAAQNSAEEWFFQGADDLHFHTGWLTAALSAHAASGAPVVGTNDLGNALVVKGRHSTHSLVHRSYLALGTIDEPGKLLHEGYDHNACDVEFIETAMARGMFVFARDAIVEHLHPLWHRDIAHDIVYGKGQRYSVRDRQLCANRRHLWNPQAPQHFIPQLRGGARWPRR